MARGVTRETQNLEGNSEIHIASEKGYLDILEDRWLTKCPKDFTYLLHAV